MKDTAKFHQALANQTILQSLCLEECALDDQFNQPESLEILLKSLSKLVNLTDLRLTELCKPIVDQHIVRLASSLPKLEVWPTKGFRLTDAIWDEVASLRSL